MLPDALAAAYLERLGVDARKGEVDAPTLAAIQRAQVTTIPYENVDIYRGRPPGIDPVACVERLVGGRGGYCYHQNGALVMLLRWLDADVTRHISGVQGRASAGPHLNANHMGVTVRTPDGAGWLVHAGLGTVPNAAAADLGRARPGRLHVPPRAVDARRARLALHPTRASRSSASTSHPPR